MAFVNPSINNGGSLLSENEKKDILDRLSKVEEEIKNIKNNNTTINEKAEIKPESDYKELDLMVNKATLNGKPLILNIPIKKNELPEVKRENNEEYTLLNPNDYANKSYMANANQRYSLLNESQRKIINDKNSKFTKQDNETGLNNSDTILSIDNIMKVS